MLSDSMIFAGVELSSGRKPVTFAALDDDLNIKTLEKCDIPTALAYLQEYERICVAINISAARSIQSAYVDFKSQMTRSGFKSFSKKDSAKQWFETKSQVCFRIFVEQTLLSQRTLEGRLQRALILYERGLRIDDPMDIFEEITRYKLRQGIFPTENIYASKELDALMAAYLAWMGINRPAQIVVKGGYVLPEQVQNFLLNENLPEALDE